MKLVSNCAKAGLFAAKSALLRPLPHVTKVSRLSPQLAAAVAKRICLLEDPAERREKKHFFERWLRGRGDQQVLDTLRYG